MNLDPDEQAALERKLGLHYRGGGVWVDSEGARLDAEDVAGIDATLAAALLRRVYSACHDKRFRSGQGQGHHNTNRRDEMNAIDYATSRLRAWIRDYGHEKQPEFIADLEMLLAASQPPPTVTLPTSEGWWWEWDVNEWVPRKVYMWHEWMRYKDEDGLDQSCADGHWQPVAVPPKPEATTPTQGAK